MVMRRCIGYMLTWTTYGSWLQGDQRGYAKDHTTYGPNSPLHRANQTLLACPPVELTTQQRDTVVAAFEAESQTLEQTIYAMAVEPRHIHLVVNCGLATAAEAASHYKNAARLALQQNGFEGKLWTRGFGKRYCFDGDQMAAVIEYVRGHNASPQNESGG
jgi:hypothetical protein